jgi:small multidrug resistance family-3 protein
MLRQAATTKEESRPCKIHGFQADQADISMEWTGFTRAFGLFFATAVAELVGCYLPLLWLSGKGSGWLLLPAALSLVIFVWLLTLHPAASGRVYATYGAIYIATALGWLWLVDGVSPTWTDFVGVALALSGAGVIAMGQRLEH